MRIHRRLAFTLIELLIGFMMMAIVTGTIAFAVKSGLELYTKAEANGVVISGIRFTVDSFNIGIAPMLDLTKEIEILQKSDPDAQIPNPSTLSADVHYLFLKNKSVVHRSSLGDKVLAGSEYIDALTFSIPALSNDKTENFVLKMELKAINQNYTLAKLDLEVEKALYNKPAKSGNNISGELTGNVLRFIAKQNDASSLSADIDLYDADTEININNLTMHRGTVIKASYDITLDTNGAESEAYTDNSTVLWYISGSTSDNLPVASASPTDTTAITQLFPLVDSGGNPITTKTLSTVGTFYVRPGSATTAWKDSWGIVIRCKLTPAVTTNSGEVVTADIVWSKFVVIKNINDKGTMWDTWLTALDSPSHSADGFYKTSVPKTDFEVNEDKELGIRFQSSSQMDAGAFTVARLDYKFMDNDRIYSIWQKGHKTGDIPSYMTMTNYSVVVDAEVDNIEAAYGIFLSTAAGNLNFGVNGDDDFEDVGYAVQFDPRNYKKAEREGILALKFKMGTEITKNRGGDDDVLPLGIFNEILNEEWKNFYSPAQLRNTSFEFNGSESDWKKRYRILYTVLEYYEEGLESSRKGPKYPCYIVRARFLKRTDNWDSENHSDPLSEIKKTDPWCIGPKFFASEPMWFGMFVANRNTNSPGSTTVKVKNYYYSSPTTVSLNRQISSAEKRFYGTKYGTTSGIFRSREMNARSSSGEDDYVSNADGGLVLSNTSRERYVGIRGVAHGSTHDEDIIIYEIDITPGFSAQELRSVMPLNGRMYEIDDTIASEYLSGITDKEWYKSFKAITNGDYNQILFPGNYGKSAGDGNNGSWYYSNAGGDGGIYDLQHIPGSCSCPLHNELFKWLGN